jgi:phospho-N-acetylmuramoyl-pentapeptide-transferase
MAIYLGILIFSFITTCIAIVPFIDLLYKLHFFHREPIVPATPLEKTEFDRISSKARWKLGTPTGGGVLLIVLVSILFLLLFPIIIRFGVYITTAFPIKDQLNVIFFTFISFGLLGFYDDIIKVFNLSPNSYWRKKAIFEVLFSFLSAFMMYTNLHIQIIYLPVIGVIHLGIFYIPIAALIILFFCRAFDITDGLDGLASGVLLICLLAFWAISVSALDTVLSTFISLWIGGLIAFLYFNVFPARIWLGNAGSLSFGATLAVVGLILGKTFPLLLIGGIFVIEAAMHYGQKVYYYLFNRKLFVIAPLHYFLESIGWPEPKIVQRLWLAAIAFAFLGLWVATA